MKEEKEVKKILKLLRILEKETEGGIQAKVALILFKFEGLYNVR